MKFLIDECLRPDLAKLAQDNGYPESSHVRWLGLADAKDHVGTWRAVDDGYVLVTHNTADFRGLYGREDLHVGLVAFNTASGLDETRLSATTLPPRAPGIGRRGGVERSLEITVDAERAVTIGRFDLPSSPLLLRFGNVKRRRPLAGGRLRK